MNRKKAQIKFGETFGIIIIVYIVVMVGMVWYNTSSGKEIREMNEENKVDRAFEKYYYVVNSNMLHLSQHGDIDEEFDLVSLRVFENYSDSEPAREMVRQQLGEALVTLDVYDNEFNLIENFTVYNRTPEEYKNREAFRTLIPVVDPIEKRTRIGMLYVYVFD